MNVSKINYTNKNIFFSALSEQKIVEGIKDIVQKREYPIVAKNIDYFIDMEKGSSINSDRKLEINDWLKANLKKYQNFDRKLNKQIVIEKIAYLEYGNMNPCKKLIKQIIDTLRNRKNKHPLMQEYQCDCNNAGFFNNFKEIFSSYIELKPSMSKPQNIDSAKAFTKDPYIGLSIEEQLEKFYKDTYNIDIKPPEIPINTKNQESLTKPAKQPIMEKPIKPDIVKDNNSNINPLKKQFDDCQIQLNAFKDYNLMSEKEKNQYHNWFKNVYHPILEKIKNNNISTVDGMIFPNNASAQDKEIFWNTLFERAAFNKASFDDALNIFEKFGKRDFSHDTGMNTLSSLAIAFPDYPDNKTSLKVFDLFEKLAVYTPDDTGDGLSFIDILQKPGVLNSENMIKIAFEKGKNFLWDVDSISALEYELIRKKDAPFAQNPKVQELFDACKLNAIKLKNSLYNK